MTKNESRQIFEIIAKLPATPLNNRELAAVRDEFDLTVHGKDGFVAVQFFGLGNDMPFPLNSEIDIEVGWPGGPPVGG